jgi:hypothetical protein
MPGYKVKIRRVYVAIGISLRVIQFYKGSRNGRFSGSAFAAQN